MHLKAEFGKVKALYLKKRNNYVTIAIQFDGNLTPLKTYNLFIYKKTSVAPQV